MADFVHPEYLVETDWLARNLSNPDVVVLDCTTHLIPAPKITHQVKPGREDFEQGHIPGNSSTCCATYRTRRSSCASCVSRPRTLLLRCGALASATALAW